MAGKRKSRGAADAIIEEIERLKPAKDEAPAWRKATEKEASTPERGRRRPADYGPQSK